MENSRPNASSLPPSSSSSSSPSSPPSSESIALEALRIMRSAGGALIVQAGLHAQLARVEWAEEKIRLLKMLLLTLLGFACVLCFMLLTGALLLALCWDTPYRIAAVLALIAVYALGALVAWRRFQLLSQRSGRAFGATREEIAADIALMRSRL